MKTFPALLGKPLERAHTRLEIIGVIACPIQSFDLIYEVLAGIIEASMARKQSRQVEPKEDEGTAERIVSAATHLFATQGYEGTSTKEICDAAQVNIAAIHYHFGSKEELYRHLIQGFGGSSLQSVQRILTPPTTAEEFRVRLQMFLEEALEPFLRQPELCKIVQAEIDLLHARSDDVFRGTFVKVFETLVDFMAQAKKRKLIARDIDPHLAARSLHSQICHHTRSDNAYKKFYHASLREEKYRTAWIKHTLRVFLAGIGEHDS